MLLGCATQTAHRKGGRIEAVEDLSVDEVRRAARPRRLALIIGVQDFAAPAWPALRYAHNDASGMHAALLESGYRAESLTGPEQTTRAGILAGLDALHERNVNENDIVLVYVSTHGTLRWHRGRPEPVLLAADTQQDAILETGISMGELTERLSRLRSRRVALLLASCHSGQGNKSFWDEETRAIADKMKGPFSALQPLIYRSEGLALLGASSLEEGAFEDDRLEHDVLTHFLLEALEDLRADSNRDGAVTLLEAYAYANERTYTFTEGRQRPFLRASFVGRDPIVLRGWPENGPPQIMSLRPEDAGTKVYQDGHLKGVFPGRVELSEGSGEVALVTDDGQRIERKLDLEAGDFLGPEDLWALAPGLEITAATGWREQVFTLGVGASIRPWSWLRLHGELFGGYSGLSRNVPGDAQTQRDVRAGLQLSAGYELPFDAFRLAVGPELAVVYEHTAYQRSERRDRDAVVLAPGAGAALGWRLGTTTALELRGGALWSRPGELAPRPFAGMGVRISP